MAENFDVCIRGAGIVGRTLALMLARERLRVALVQAPAAVPAHADVRAFALNQSAREMLLDLRCWPLNHASTPVMQMRIHADQDAALNFHAMEQGVEALAWIVDVAALEERLSDAIQYQPDIEVVSAPVNAPLTVVCEGRHSLTRSQLGVHYETTPYPHTAIAARLQSTQPHEQIARQWFASSEVLALLPQGGESGNFLSLVWSVDHARAAELLQLDDAEFTQTLEQAADLPHESLTLCSARAHWTLQHSRAQRWCGSFAHQPAQRWVLAGDAAHAVHPLAGQGLNLGLGDVHTLVRLIRSRSYWRSHADVRLLRQYERERKAATWIMGQTGDGLQMLFSHTSPMAQWARQWGMKGFERSAWLKSFAARMAGGKNTFLSPWA